MNQVLPVLSIALPIFGLIRIGGIAGKAGFLGRDATSALNVFVVYLSLPAACSRGWHTFRPPNRPMAA